MYGAELGALGYKPPFTVRRSEALLGTIAELLGVEIHDRQLQLAGNLRQR